MMFTLKIALLLLALTSCSTQEPMAGEPLFEKHCMTCHSSSLKGGNASSLFNGVWRFGADDHAVTENIKSGIPHLGMPAFGGSLSDEDIQTIIRYIKTKEKHTQSRAVHHADLETLDYSIKSEIWVNALEIPWAIDFVDDQTALITERPGRLRIVENGKLLASPVSGTPVVLAEGQGGLLDVAVDPDYSKNGWIYLSYSHVLKNVKSYGRPLAMTRIVRGKIRNHKWTGQQVLFEAKPEHYNGKRIHYGCRIVFDSKGYLYFSVGDRGMMDQAQDVSRPNGKIHRILRDGRIPKDNPFVGQKNALPTIFTFGNRNPQGLAVHPQTDDLWQTEHGPKGGDELNLLQNGKNYGWPEVSYGINYNGTILTEFTEKPGMVNPVYYWRPSIAVCGLDFYSGDMFPRWKNHLISGALKYEEVRIIDIKENRVLHEEVILKDEGRVRDVMCGPDGAIYVVLNSPGQVLRLVRRD